MTFSFTFITTENEIYSILDKPQDIDVSSMEPIQIFWCLYIDYYRRISTPKVGEEAWWNVCRHFCGAYWDTDTYIAWDVKRNFKSSYRYHWLGAYRTNALYSGHIFIPFNDLEDVFTWIVLSFYCLDLNHLVRVFYLFMFHNGCLWRRLDVVF